MESPVLQPFKNLLELLISINQKGFSSLDQQHSFFRFDTDCKTIKTGDKDHLL